MKPAYYMAFVEGHHGSLDKIGGLPDHLPDRFPVSPHTGETMAFLAQLYCSSERLNLPGIKCMQLYQIAEDYDPLPTIITVSESAMPNVDKIGRAKLGLVPHDIMWEKRDDPDILSSPRTYSAEEHRFAESKCGGISFFEAALEIGDKFIVQLREGPEGLNFGGYTVIIVIDDQNNLHARLG